MFYISIDDTDNHNHPMGTGKMARLLSSLLEEKCEGLHGRGVVRHQLLVDPRIPYTSHNSPACIILKSQKEEAELFPLIKEIAIPYILQNSASGADPGFCLISQNKVNGRIINFGISAGKEVLSKDKAQSIADEMKIDLLELGGTGDGIIGTLAAVGLTRYGFSGRFLEYKGSLRDIPEKVPVRTGGYKSSVSR